MAMAVPVAMGVAALASVAGGVMAYKQGQSTAAQYEASAKEAGLSGEVEAGQIAQRFGIDQAGKALEASTLGVDPYGGTILAARARDRQNEGQDLLMAKGNAAAQRRQLLAAGSNASLSGVGGLVGGFGQAAGYGAQGYSAFTGRGPVR